MRPDQLCYLCRADVDIPLNPDSLARPTLFRAWAAGPKVMCCGSKEEVVFTRRLSATQVSGLCPHIRWCWLCWQTAASQPTEHKLVHPEAGQTGPCEAHMEAEAVDRMQAFCRRCPPFLKMRPRSCPDAPSQALEHASSDQLLLIHSCPRAGQPPLCRVPHYRPQDLPSRSSRLSAGSGLAASSSRHLQPRPQNPHSCSSPCACQRGAAWRCPPAGLPEHAPAGGQLCGSPQ